MALERTKFVGFYWTQPVPHAGFTGLSSDVDVAAGQSKTIRYQRDRARSWVRDQNGEMVHERVFLELEPGRSSEHLVHDVHAAIVIARKLGADLVTVDFSKHYGWRPHHLLQRALSCADIDCHALWPDPVRIEGEEFDPVTHFRAWSERTKAHAGSKDDHRNQVLALIEQLKAESATLAGLADTLNEWGMRTHGGKPWKADNLRKFLKS